jgi:hypothetical protein
MADTSVSGSFAFRCLATEANLMAEALQASNEIMQGDVPDVPSAVMAARFTPTRTDEPWSGLAHVMPDPEVPGLNVDFSMDKTPDDSSIAIVCFSGRDDFEPLSIAALIHHRCRATLATGPVGFEWAVTSSWPRLDQFGGGWCAVFADRIDYENTGRGLSRALAARPSDVRGSVSIALG